MSAGPLGEAFELSQGDGDGFVQLTFFRGEALAGGSGRLAAAEVSRQSRRGDEFVFGSGDRRPRLSDSTGVIDLRQKDTIGPHNGQVAVSPQHDIDNAGSGLPDWWEEFSTDWILSPTTCHSIPKTTGCPTCWNMPSAETPR